MLRFALAVCAVVVLTEARPVRAQARVDSLEVRLSQARGTDRLPVLVDLAEALSEADPDRALAYGRAARSSFDPQTDPNLVRRLWEATADAHSAAGRPDSTLAHAARLRQWAEAAGDARGLADAAYLEGTTYRSQRAFDEALASLEDARERYQALGLRPRVADVANAIGRTYMSMPEYDKALAAYARALTLYEALGDDVGRSNVYSNIGIVHAMRGDLDQAAPAFTRVVEIREKIGDEAQVASALANLGALRFEEGDIRESLALQQRALAIRERLGNKADLAYSLHNIGIAQNELGHHAEALRALTRSAALFEEVGDDVSAASALSNTGVTHAERGDHEQALAFQQRALALNEKAREPLGVGLTLNRIGDAYRALGNYAGALEAQERALEVLSEAGLDAHVPTVLMAIGTIYSEQRQYAEALDVLERALALEQAMGDRQSIAAGALLIGQVYLAQGDLAAALAYTDEALADADASGVLILVRNAHEQRAKILELQERFPEALAAYRSFKVANDSLFTSESQSVAAQLQAEYRTKEQRQRIELLERERAVQRLWVGGLVGGLVLLSLLVGLAFNRYRLKQRANVVLTRARDDLQATQEQLQAAMQKTEAQSAQLAELDEAKSRFFANISHELRTPLTLTLGPLEDLRSGAFGRLSAQGEEQVDLALRNSRRLLRLVGQLLDVAKLESGRFDLQLQTEDLGGYVRTLAQAFVAAAERRRIAFAIEVPSRPVPVRFDPEHLDKVVANLLSNALKFTPAGERVTLRLAREGEDAVVTVRDTGPGIPDDQIAMLFDRFAQGEKSEMQPGTGIGLALAKELAELHGGALTVESEIGVGSAFTLRLPLAKTQSDGEVEDIDFVLVATAPSAETGIALDDPHTNGVLEMGSKGEPDKALHEDRTTVLVVDDNADIRAYVRRHLEDDGAAGSGYRVVEAVDGEAALAAVRTRLPDLVVSDVMMPHLDGFGLLEALRGDAETDFVPVVLLTARAEAEDRLAGLGLGADDYLTKPFDARELVARVDNLIAQRHRLRERFRQAPQETDGTHLPALHPAPVEVTSVDAEFVESVRAAAEAGLGDEDFGVDALAQAVGRSRSSLHQRLSELLGETPSALLRRMRLERGADLLREGAGTVSEVAYASGFKSVSHFSSSFGKHFGQTPTAYAAEHAASRP